MTCPQTKAQQRKQDYTVASEQLKRVRPDLFRESYPPQITHEQIQVLESERKEKTKVLLLPHDKLKEWILEQWRIQGLNIEDPPLNSDNQPVNLETQ